MTPPPEQYVIDIPRRLPRGSKRHLGTQLFPLIYVPALDVFAIALLAGAVALLVPAVSPRILLVPTVLVLTVPIRGTRDLNRGLLEDFGSIARRCTAAFALAAAVAAVGGSTGGREALVAACGSFPLLLAARGSAHALQRRQLRKGHRSPALVIGTGDTALKVIATLQGDPDYGLKVVGVLGKGPAETERYLGTRLLGTAQQATDVTRYRRVRTVIIASDGTEDRDIVPSVRHLLEDGVNVWVVPRLFEVGTDFPAQHIGGIPVVRLRPPTHKRPGWTLKRLLDVALSAAGLVASAPLFGVVALAIKLDSRGPVLFRQERIGLDGKPFHILKFRTMLPRSTLHEQTEWSPEQRDITRVGRLLRATALDELPQLVNVLKGELALVGPRPERPAFVKIFEEAHEGYADRHRVPSGITGWAQIHGLRGDTPIDDRARFDNHYIENWSFAGDLKILLLTARTYFRRYRPQGTSEQDEEDGVTDLAKVG